MRYDKDILEILGLLELANKDILTFNKKEKKVIIRTTYGFNDCTKYERITSTNYHRFNI